VEVSGHAVAGTTVEDVLGGETDEPVLSGNFTQYIAASAFRTSSLAVTSSLGATAIPTLTVMRRLRDPHSAPPGRVRLGLRRRLPVFHRV